MRITILNGSPRKGGNTEALVSALAEGAQAAGAEVTVCGVRGKRIGPCCNCDYCYTHEGCALRDDMDGVYELLLRTDALVFATPVYFYTMSAQLKALIDRLHNPARARMPIRATAVLSVCADDDRAAFDPLLATFAAIEGYLGWRRVGEVTVENVEKKGAIAGHPALAEARALGEKLARSGGEAQAGGVKDGRGQKRHCVVLGLQKPCVRLAGAGAGTKLQREAGEETLPCLKPVGRRTRRIKLMRRLA